MEFSHTGGGPKESVGIHEEIIGVLFPKEGCRDAFKQTCRSKAEGFSLATVRHESF